MQTVAGGWWLVAKAAGCPLGLQAARRGHQPPAATSHQRARCGSWPLLAATGLSGQPSAFATSSQPL